MAEITIMESIKKIRYRPQIGMSLVFIDQCRPSDLTTVRLPKIGKYVRSDRLFRDPV